MMKLYTHDCNKCKFLGTQPVGDTRFDWYLCPGFRPEVVARMGDDGPDYWSMTESMVIDKDNFYGGAHHDDPMIATARRMLAAQ